MTHLTRVILYFRCYIDTLITYAYTADILQKLKINYMKKILTLLVVVFLGASVVAFSKTVTAGGPAAAIFTFSPSSSSATADGQSAISVSIFAYDYKCSTPDTYGSYHYSTDPNYCAANGYGTSNTDPLALSDLTVSASGSGNVIAPTSIATDATGHANFSIKSSVAETKTITISAFSGNYIYGTTSLSFTNPAPAQTPSAPTTSAPKTSTTPTPTTTPTQAPTTNASTAPATPNVSTVMIGNAPADTAKPITLDQSKPLVVSGTTVPNGVVTLTIHSTPKTATITADKDGHWTYTISGLETGDHYVEAAVTDPATNKTSPNTKILAFTLTKAPTKIATTATTPKKKQSHAVLIGVIVILMLAALGGAWYVWRRKKSHKLL